MIESGTTGLPPAEQASPLQTGCRRTPWYEMWDFIHILSAYIIPFITSMTDAVRNHRVLELGSGTGFLGLTISELQRTSQDLTTTSLKLTDIIWECRKNRF